MWRFTAAIFLAGLLGCGGGSSPEAASAPSVPLSGVAATGAPIAGKVYALDAQGRSLSVDTALDGSFALNVGTLSLPVLLKAEWAGGAGTQRLYSFATRAGRVNVTPLTDLAVRLALLGTDPGAHYASPSPVAFAALAAALPTAITQLRTALRPLLAAHGADADPFTITFVADHTGVDRFLDSVAITTSGLTLSVTDVVTGTLLYSASLTKFAAGTSALAWTQAHALVANDPEVALDPTGRALVAWVQQGASHWDILARWLDGTSAAVRINDGAGEGSQPRLAFDGVGNAWATWAQYGAGANEIWVNRCSVGGAWGTPQKVSASGFDAYYPDVKCDGAGNVIVAWYEATATTNHFDVRANRFTAGGAWGAPVRLSDGTHSAYRCRLALNAAGEGLVLWSQDVDETLSNGPKDILARRFTGAGGWASEVQLNSVPGATQEIYGQVAAALDSAGNATALWVQAQAGGAYVIWANRFTPAGGWGTAGIITSAAISNCYGPDVAVDAAGRARAVWSQQTGLGAFAASNSASASGVWGTSVEISDGTGDCYDIRVAVDAAGNAAANWYQMDPDGADSVRMNRFTQGGTWGNAVLVDRLASPGFLYPVPRVALSDLGTCYVVWGMDSY